MTDRVTTLQTKPNSLTVLATVMQVAYYPPIKNGNNVRFRLKNV